MTGSWMLWTTPQDSGQESLSPPAPARDHADPTRYDKVVAALVNCAGDMQCAKNVIRPYSVDAGPELAVKAIKEYNAMDDSAGYACHDIYESIARAVTAARGPLPFYNSECQFGYTHGVLYAMGETYDDTRSLVEAGVKYCAGYSHDPDSINSPDMACYHGLGHALADVTYDQPSDAVAACVDASVYQVSSLVAPSYFAESCADGVFMQYGDGHLHASVPGAAPATKVDPGAIPALCQELDDVLAAPCYARLWKFTDLRYQSVASAAATCLSARASEAVNPCLRGFGELFVWTSKTSWPPMTRSESESFAKQTAAECVKHPKPLECLYGVMASTNSHMYAVGYDRELIPNPCMYVPESLSKGCYALDSDIRGLNWDKTNGSDAARSDAVSP